MMKLELGGVVDDQLRDYGVKGLSVADASFMPITPASAPCMGYNLCCWGKGALFQKLVILN